MFVNEEEVLEVPFHSAVFLSHTFSLFSITCGNDDDDDKIGKQNFHTNTYALPSDAVCVLPMLHSPFFHLRTQHSIEENKTVKSSRLSYTLGC